MNSIYLLLVMVFATNTSTFAQSPFENYKWEKRLVILTGNDEEQSGYKSQLKEILSDKKGLAERDLIIILVSKEEVREQSGKQLEITKSEALRFLDIQNDHQALFLIGKDGGIKMRSSDFVNLESIFKKIDAMPMRRREMKNK